MRRLRRLLVASVRPALPVAAALLGAGCAAAVTALEGESHGKNLDLHVSGALSSGHGSIRLEVANHTEDAVGVDLDALRLVDHAGTSHEPLGRSQRFRSAGGESSTRRVPYGSITLGPSQSQTVELEFAGLPAEALTLTLPSVYRMGIDGQENLHAIKLPLHLAQAAARPVTASSDEPATREREPRRASDEEAPPGERHATRSQGDERPARDGGADGFFDPFVEWY